MAERLAIRVTLVRVSETPYGTGHISVCLGCLSAGCWTPSGGWRLNREAELVLDGSLARLTTLAREVWDEATKGGDGG